MKRVIIFGAVAFGIFWIAKDPDGAADVARGVLDIAEAVANGFVKFFGGLM